MHKLEVCSVVHKFFL